MKLPRSPYSDRFYRKQSLESSESTQAVVPILLGLFRPDSVLDVGCGAGVWLKTFQDFGVTDVLGVDRSDVPPSSLAIDSEQFQPRDLTESMHLGRKYDLVISLEVAEHLPESVAETFVDNLTRHSDLIVFSAAIPLQGGTDHVNEQWPDYWNKKFLARGYKCFDVIRPRIWDMYRVAGCYKQNMFVFAKGASSLGLDSVPQAKWPTPLCAVHPDLWPPSPRVVMGLLIPSISRAMSKGLRMHPSSSPKRAVSGTANQESL
jgi:SAM-dependent methyltransferase